jgi:DNA-binding NarL/FixJ family response regulator
MRVVIGEDDALYREGLARLLSEAGFEIVGQARDAPELERKVAGHRPDIVVTDVRMPPRRTDDGLRSAIAIRQRFPDTAVLVLSQYVAQRPAAELIGSSAKGVGYLLKERVTDLEQFIDAVRRVGAGGTALDPEIVSRLVGRHRGGPLDELTPRERQVLELMAEGYSNQRIAELLVVTEHSVVKHIGNILRKLGIRAAPEGHRRVLAVLTYLRAADTKVDLAVPKS